MELTGIKIGIDAGLAKQGKADFNSSIDEMIAKSRTVSSQITSSMRGAEGGVTSFGQRMRTVSMQVMDHLDSIGKGFQGVVSSILNFRTLADTAIAGVSINKLTEYLTRVENIKIALEAGTGSAQKAGQMWEYLNTQANKLGFSSLDLGRKFASLIAATDGTALEGQRTIKIFEGINMAAAALGGGTEQLERMTQAFTNILSQENMQGPMIVRMLARTAGIPNAMQVAARAYGIGVDQMIAKLRQGGLSSEEFVLKFTTQLGKEFPEAAAKAADSTQAWKERMGNAFEALMDDIGEGGFGGALKQMFKDLTVTLESPAFRQAATEIGTFLAGALRTLTSAVQFAGEHIGLLKVAVGGLVLFEVLGFVANLAKNVLILATAFGTAATAARGLAVAEGMAAVGGAAAIALAQGGVMTSRGSMPLRKYAGGGIATSPQMAIFGEGSKPEAFVPLQDGQSIPVTMSMHMVRQAEAAPMFPSVPLPSVTGAFVPLPDGRRIPAKLTLSPQFQVRRYATGGVANAPQAALWGEAGPEARVPFSDGAIPFTFDSAMGQFGGSQAFSFLNLGSMQAEMRRLKDSVNVLESKAQVAPASHPAPAPIPTRTISTPPPTPATTASVGGFHIPAAASVLAPLLMAIPMLLGKSAVATERTAARIERPAVHAFAPREIASSFDRAMERTYGGAVSDKMLAQLRDFVTPHATQPVRYLASGGEHHVFDIAEDKIARFGWGDAPPSPNIPEVLQPIATKMIPNRRGSEYMHAQIMPKADTNSVSEGDLRTMNERMHTLGWEWDRGTGNLGKYQGQTRIIDTGGMYRKAGDENMLEDVVAHERQMRDENPRRRAAEEEARRQTTVHAMAERPSGPIDVAFAQRPSSLVTVYRGEREGGAPSRSGMQFFTPDRDYAARYGTVRSSQLDVGNFFDTRRPEHRDILDTMNARREHGDRILADPATGTPLYSDASRLRMLLADAGHKFSGMALSENAGILGHGGLSYAKFQKPAEGNEGVHAMAERAAFVVPGKPLPSDWPVNVHARWSGGPDTGHWAEVGEPARRPIASNERIMRETDPGWKAGPFKDQAHEQFLAEQAKAAEHERRAEGARRAWVKIRADRAAAVEAADQRRLVDELAGVRPADVLSAQVREAAVKAGAGDTTANRLLGNLAGGTILAAQERGDIVADENIAKQAIEHEHRADGARRAWVKIRADRAAAGAVAGEQMVRQAGSTEAVLRAADPRGSGLLADLNNIIAEKPADALLGTTPGVQGQLFGVRNRGFEYKSGGVEMPSGPAEDAKRKLVEMLTKRFPIEGKTIERVAQFTAPSIAPGAEPTFIRAGLEHAVYDLGGQNVLRIGYGPQENIPHVPQILQPVRQAGFKSQIQDTRQAIVDRHDPQANVALPESEMIGKGVQLHAQIMPKVEGYNRGAPYKVKEQWSQAAYQLKTGLKLQGYNWGDSHAGNVGRMPGGEFKVIDPGFMKKGLEQIVGAVGVDKAWERAAQMDWKTTMEPRGDYGVHYMASRAPERDVTQMFPGNDTVRQAALRAGAGERTANALGELPAMDYPVLRRQMAAGSPELAKEHIARFRLRHAETFGAEDIGKPALGYAMGAQGELFGTRMRGFEYKPVPVPPPQPQNAARYREFFNEAIQQGMKRYRLQFSPDDLEQLWNFASPHVSKAATVLGGGAEHRVFDIGGGKVFRLGAGGEFPATPAVSSILQPFAEKNFPGMGTYRDESRYGTHAQVAPFALTYGKDQDAFPNVERMVRNLKVKAAGEGVWWSDSHSGNVGLYPAQRQGKPYIIDPGYMEQLGQSEALSSIAATEKERSRISPSILTSPAPGSPEYMERRMALLKRQLAGIDEPFSSDVHAYRRRGQETPATRTLFQGPEPIFEPAGKSSPRTREAKNIIPPSLLPHFPAGWENVLKTPISQQAAMDRMKQLTGARENLAAAQLGQRLGFNWYEMGRELPQALHDANALPVSPEQFLRMNAATSPQTNVARNLAETLELTRNLQELGPEKALVSPGNFEDVFKMKGRDVVKLPIGGQIDVAKAKSGNVSRALFGGPLSGNKVFSFDVDLLRGGMGTIDSLSGKGLGANFKLDVPSNYLATRARMSQAAALGEAPINQVQAGQWVATRALNEGPKEMLTAKPAEAVEYIKRSVAGGQRVDYANTALDALAGSRPTGYALDYARVDKALRSILGGNKERIAEFQANLQKRIAPLVAEAESMPLGEPSPKYAASFVRKAQATIRGPEADVAFNPEELGSVHAFAERKRGFETPDTRLGLESAREPLIRYTPDPQATEKYMQLKTHGIGEPYLFDTARTTWNWNKDRSMLSIHEQNDPVGPFSRHTETREVPASAVKGWDYINPESLAQSRPGSLGMLAQTETIKRTPEGSLQSSLFISQLRDVLAARTERPSGPWRDPQFSELYAKEQEDSGVHGFALRKPGFEFAQDLPEKMAATHAATEGATFNPRTAENLIGRPAWSVGVAPELSQVLSRMPGPADFRAFAEKNRDMFENFKNAQMGSWHDMETGLHHLDVVGLSQSKNRAMQVATDIGEKGIFNLKTTEYLPTGYTAPQRPPLRTTVGERLTELDTATEGVHALRGPTPAAVTPVGTAAMAAEEAMVRKLEEASRLLATETGGAAAPVTDSMRAAARGFAQAGMTPEVAAALPVARVGIGGLKDASFRGQFDDATRAVRIAVGEEGAKSAGVLAHEIGHALLLASKDAMPQLQSAVDAEFQQILGREKAILGGGAGSIRALGPAGAKLVNQRIGGLSSYSVESRDVEEHKAEAIRIKATGTAEERRTLAALPATDAMAEAVITQRFNTGAPRLVATQPREFAGAIESARRTSAPIPEMEALQQLERVTIPMPGKMEMLGGHIGNLSMAAQMAAFPLMSIAPKAGELIFMLSNLGMVLPMIPQIMQSLKGLGSLFNGARPAARVAEVAEEGVHAFAKRGVTPPQLEEYADMARQHSRAAEVAREAMSARRTPGQVTPEVIEQALLNKPQIHSGTFGLPGGGTLKREPLLLKGEVEQQAPAIVGLFERMWLGLKNQTSIFLATWKTGWEMAKTAAIGIWDGITGSGLAAFSKLKSIAAAGSALIKDASSTPLDFRKIDVSMGNVFRLNRAVKPVGVIAEAEKVAGGLGTAEKVAVDAAGIGQAAVAGEKLAASMAKTAATEAAVAGEAAAIGTGLEGAAGGGGLLSGAIGVILSPIGMAVAAVAALGLGLYLARDNQVKINGEAYKMSDIYRGAWDAIKDKAAGFWEWLKKIGSETFGLLKGFAADFIDAFAGRGRAASLSTSDFIDAAFGEGTAAKWAKKGKAEREEMEKTARDLQSIAVEFGTGKVGGSEYTGAELYEMKDGPFYHNLEAMEQYYANWSRKMQGHADKNNKAFTTPPRPQFPWESQMEELGVRAAFAPAESRAQLLGPDAVEQLKEAADLEKFIIQLQRDINFKGLLPQEKADIIAEARRDFQIIAQSTMLARENASEFKRLQEMRMAPSLTRTPVLEEQLPPSTQALQDYYAKIDKFDAAFKKPGARRMLAPPERPTGTTNDIELQAFGFKNAKQAIDAGTAAYERYNEAIKDEAQILQDTKMKRALGQITEEEVQMIIKKQQAIREEADALKFLAAAQAEVEKNAQAVRDADRSLAARRTGDLGEMRHAAAVQQAEGTMRQQYKVSTPEEYAKLPGATADATEALRQKFDALVKSNEEQMKSNDIQATANELIRQYDPGNAFKEQISKINEAWDAGKISVQEYQFAVMDAREAYARSMDDMLMKTRTFEGGARAALDQYARDAMDAAQNAKRTFDNLFSGLEDSFTNLMLGKGANFKAVFNRLKEDIARSFVRENITGPLARFITGNPDAGKPMPKGTQHDPLFVSLVSERAAKEANAGGGFMNRGGLFGWIFGHDDRKPWDEKIPGAISEQPMGIFGGVFGWFKKLFHKEHSAPEIPEVPQDVPLARRGIPEMFGDITGIPVLGEAGGKQTQAGTLQAALIGTFATSSQQITGVWIADATKVSDTWTLAGVNVFDKLSGILDQISSNSGAGGGSALSDLSALGDVGGSDFGSSFGDFLDSGSADLAGEALATAASRPMQIGPPKPHNVYGTVTTGTVVPGTTSGGGGGGKFADLFSNVLGTVFGKWPAAPTQPSAPLPGFSFPASTMTDLFPGLASGGKALKGTSYMVGEHGPELFTPQQSGFVVPNHMLGGGPMSMLGFASGGIMGGANASGGTALGSVGGGGAPDSGAGGVTYAKDPITHKRRYAIFDKWVPNKSGGFSMPMSTMPANTYHGPGFWALDFWPTLMLYFSNFMAMYGKLSAGGNSMNMGLMGKLLGMMHLLPTPGSTATDVGQGGFGNTSGGGIGMSGFSGGASDAGGFGGSGASGAIVGGPFQPGVVQPINPEIMAAIGPKGSAEALAKTPEGKWFGMVPGDESRLYNLNNRMSPEELAKWRPELLFRPSPSNTATNYGMGGFGNTMGGGIGFASGGIMTSFGPVPLRKYDGGGIATYPQAAIFGEGSRPEAYVPLPDGRSIPVNMNMRDSGINSQSGRTSNVYRTEVHVHGVQNIDGFQRSRPQIVTEMSNAQATHNQGRRR